MSQKDVVAKAESLAKKLGITKNDRVFTVASFDSSSPSVFTTLLAPLSVGAASVLSWSQHPLDVRPHFGAGV